VANGVLYVLSAVQNDVLLLDELGDPEHHDGRRRPYWQQAKGLYNPVAAEVQ